jgi:predicted nucleic acid-binding protein
VLVSIIADTKVFLSVTLDEPEKSEIIKATAKASLISPEILPYEIGNALSKLVRRDLETPESALEIFSTTQLIPVRLMPVNIVEALNIASKFKIYSYDAYFLECAIEHNAPLLSLDRQMLRVAKELYIKIVDL